MMKTILVVIAVWVSGASADSHSPEAGYPYVLDVKIPLTEKDVEITRHSGHIQPGAPIDRPWTNLGIQHVPSDPHILIAPITLGQTFSGANVVFDSLFKAAEENGGALNGQMRIDETDYYETRVYTPRYSECEFSRVQVIEVTVPYADTQLILSSEADTVLSTTSGACSQ